MDKVSGWKTKYVPVILNNVLLWCTTIEASFYTPSTRSSFVHSSLEFKLQRKNTNVKFIQTQTRVFLRTAEPCQHVTAQPAIITKQEGCWQVRRLDGSAVEKALLLLFMLMPNSFDNRYFLTGCSCSNLSRLFTTCSEKKNLKRRIIGVGSRIIKYTMSQEAKSREVVLVDVRLVLMTTPVDTYKNRLIKTR